jgi:hypothetical protein
LWVYRLCAKKPVTFPQPLKRIPDLSTASKGPLRCTHCFLGDLANFLQPVRSTRGLPSASKGPRDLPLASKGPLGPSYQPRKGPGDLPLACKGPLGPSYQPRKGPGDLPLASKGPLGPSYQPQGVPLVLFIHLNGTFSSPPLSTGRPFPPPPSPHPLASSLPALHLVNFKFSN